MREKRVQNEAQFSVNNLILSSWIFIQPKKKERENDNDQHELN